MKLSEFLSQRPDLDPDIDVFEEDVVTDVLIAMRAVQMADEQTTDALVLAASDNTTGIIQYGIVCAAKLELDRLMTDGED